MFCRYANDWVRLRSEETVHLRAVFCQRTFVSMQIAGNLRVVCCVLRFVNAKKDPCIRNESRCRRDVCICHNMSTFLLFYTAFAQASNQVDFVQPSTVSGFVAAERVERLFRLMRPRTTNSNSRMQTNDQREILAQTRTGKMRREKTIGSQRM